MAMPIVAQAIKNAKKFKGKPKGKSPARKGAGSPVPIDAIRAWGGKR